MRILRRLMYVFRGRRHEVELAEEMEFHRQMAEAAERENGRPDASDSARRRMGNMMQASEEARGVWLAPWVEGVWQDLQYGARSLIKQPGFTAMALLALGLGIGLNTSLFTVFNAVALRPWPVLEPGRMVNILTTEPGRMHQRFGGFGAVEYRFLRDNSRTLQGVILMRSEQVRIDEQVEGQRSRCHFVTGNYFDVLGVQMALGRGLTAEEDKVEDPRPVAVLSYQTWQTRYGGDAGILGRTIRLDGAPFMVVGVADEAFTGTSMDRHDVWVPMATLPVVRPLEKWARQMLTDPHFCCSSMAGRLADGATREQAQAELTALTRQFQSQLGEKPHDVMLTGTAFFARPDSKKKVITVMGLLMAAVAAVLLLACANVSNLLLARAAARQREIAVRLSLGAGRRRIVRQLLTESLLLAVAAGGLGLGLAQVLPDFVLRQMADAPPVLNLRPDTAVLAYTSCIAMLTAVLFGLAPALRGTRMSVNEAMKGQSANVSPRFRLRSVLLGVQVAISVVLLMSSGLFLQGLRRAEDRDPGFAVDGVTILTVDLPVDRYDEQRGSALMAEAAERIGPIAGSGKVAMALLAPLGNARIVTGFRMPGQREEQESPLAGQAVSGEYFEVLGIPMLAGRSFVPGDRGRHSIIVNEAMARRYWPSGSPVGSAILTGKDRREIVGVARDAEILGLGPAEPMYFEPYDGGNRAVLVFRANEAAGRQAAALVSELEKGAVVSVTPMRQQLERWLGPTRIGAAMAAALGLLALVLASVGVYGVIAYSVEQRRREIGVRVALGARPGQMVGFILKSNARALMAGLGAGALGAIAMAKLVRKTFPDVSGLDPVVWAGVMLILMAAGVAACVMPARRAGRVDPVRALQHE